ncbi:MAG: aldehyde dehydrogenase family protein [Acidimicrobiales bacterium]|nr:aldehyde dehydrogenase family protein [Acidimicrobiales bacterium]
MTATIQKTFDAAAIVGEVRQGFDAGVTRSLQWRDAQLDAMATMLEDNADKFAAALNTDLGKASTESWLTEIGFTLSDIAHTRSHLAKWAKPRKASVPVTFQPGKAKVVPEPKGVVLVIAPWNYPVQLLLSPMVAAIAAGNAIVAKPSELAPATSAMLSELCAKYLDTSVIRVVEGAVEESTALLEQPFDHIFFTGGTRVGKIVMRAAAEHLTPVTLELGGKSPAIVAADANVEIAGRRLAWGKFVNAGQTCIAPDYLLVERGMKEPLLKAIKKSLGEFYGSDPKKSADYGRLVSDDHFDRIQGLLTGAGSGSVAIGGTTDRTSRFVEPTVLIDSDPESAVMSEEIFGPLLPVLETDSIDDAIRFVRERPKPLALYVFSEDDDTVEKVLAETSSGGVSVNGTLLHIGPPELPFGGIGPSGMGAYHGKTGFETFSHLKSVYQKSTRLDLKVLYPPYTTLKERILKLVQ